MYIEPLVHERRSFVTESSMTRVDVCHYKRAWRSVAYAQLRAAGE